MKVSKQTWRERMNNLMERRKSGYKLKNTDTKTGDYKSHLSKVNIGKKVLDVGCGYKIIETLIPVDRIYTGIDPFPSCDGVLPIMIEDNNFTDREFNTTFAFAVLDGVQDFDKTMSEIQRVTSDNIVLLTGVNIPADKYHTFELTEDIIASRLPEFKLNYREELAPRVLLLEYIRVIR